MTLTLSCDHRILYGADAARFLAAIKELLERPLRLLLSTRTRRSGGAAVRQLARSGPLDAVKQLGYLVVACRA